MNKKELQQSVGFTLAGLVCTVILIIGVTWLASFFYNPIGIKPVSIYILVLSFGGGLGGLCYSLIENKGYLKLCSIHRYEDDKDTEDKKKENKEDEKRPDVNDKKLGLDLGCIGDILIGIGSAFAVFLVLSGLVKLTKDSIDLGNIFMLASLGIVAGAGGKYIFPMLVKKMQEMIDAKDTANKALQKASDTGDEAKKDHKESLIQLDRALVPIGNLYLDKENLGQAERSFNYALEVNPQSAEAKVGLALIKRRQGYLEDAIKFCTDAIKIAPNFAIAYYNRACYKCLSEQPVKEILDDLKKAIELDESLRKYARDDEDFKSIKDSKEFQEIIK